jgi:hypothetical protein
MLIMSLVGVWAAYHFWQVGRTVDQDLLGVTQRAASEDALPSQTDGIDNVCQPS